MLPHVRFPPVLAGVRAAKMHKGDLYNYATTIMLGDLVLQFCIKPRMGTKGAAPSALLLNFHLWLS